jgi:hypothetical protein
VIHRLAGSNGTVMARRTTARHLRMINARGWSPYRGGMTAFARVARLICRILAGRIGAIVATRTAAGDARRSTIVVAQLVAHVVPQSEVVAM